MLIVFKKAKKTEKTAFRVLFPGPFRLEPGLRPFRFQDTEPYNRNIK